VTSVIVTGDAKGKAKSNIQSSGITTGGLVDLIKTAYYPKTLLGGGILDFFPTCLYVASKPLESLTASGAYQRN